MAQALKRRARIRRATRETDIDLALVLDGRGRSTTSTGIGFLDHMLDALARHGGFDLTLKARGDLHVDQHHTLEDIGLVLGAAVREALGDQRGTLRAGWWVMPMDEALALVALDLGGRSRCEFRGGFTAPKVGALDTAVVEEFFQGFAQGALANVQVVVLGGRSAHHQIEAVFKAFARALRTATTRDRQLQQVLPSTKGAL